MKKLLQVLSYILVAAMASAITFGVCRIEQRQETGKLERLDELIDTMFIGESDATAREDAAAAAMVASLGDRWSYYIPASQYESYKEQMNNSYVGIGVTIQADDTAQGIEIIKVEDNGPAKEAGLEAGDLIVAVDQTRIPGMNVDQVRELVKGKEGTFVELTVVRSGAEQTFQVERRTVQVIVATGTMLQGNIGLVRIVNFDARCASETVAVIRELLDAGAESLIFDVRFNPGGYAREMVTLLDFLLPEGELFRTVNYAGTELVDRSEADCLEIPMAVIVNAESYSAAEFFAAALRDYDAAVVVGEQTVGKGYYQNTFALGDGSAVGLSIGKYFTPGGVSLEGVGITPDVVVEVDDQTLAAIYTGNLEPMEDPQILAAIEALKK